MPRHELTDAQWARVEPLLPANGRRGGQWGDHRPLVNGMVWRLKTGAPWREVPARLRPVADGVRAVQPVVVPTAPCPGMAEVLLVDLDNAGGVDWDLWCIDGTVVRASRAAAGAAAAVRREKGGGFAEARRTTRLGRGKGGYGTKIHIVCDGNAVPAGHRPDAGAAARVDPLRAARAVGPRRVAGRAAGPAGRGQGVHGRAGPRRGRPTWGSSRSSPARSRSGCPATMPSSTARPTAAAEPDRVLRSGG